MSLILHIVIQNGLQPTENTTKIMYVLAKKENFTVPSDHQHPDFCPVFPKRTSTGRFN